MERCKTILVSGTSIDGKISPGRGISSKNFGSYVPKEVGLELHRLRSEADGILVSSSTVLTDNPSLTVRDILIKKRPYRIIVDRLGKIPRNSKVLNNEADTIIITSRIGKLKFVKTLPNIKILVCRTSKNRINLTDALISLRRIGIKNVLIEGGGTINYDFFSNNLIDKWVVFIFPFIIGGKDTPTMVDGRVSFHKNFKKMRLKSVKRINNCVVNLYEN